MIGVVRRRLASRASSYSILSQTIKTTRSAASSPVICQNEIINLSSGCGCRKKVHHLVSQGYSSSIRPTREVIASLQLHSTTKVWSRSFSSENGDLVNAVVPYMGESITDGTLAKFLKNPGDSVAVDEPIAQVETDKVTIDVVSPEAGVIQEFVAKEGDTVEPGAKIAVISKSGEAVSHVASSETPSKSSSSSAEQVSGTKQPLEAQSAPGVEGSGDLFYAAVPYMGESISDGILAKFLKNPGDSVAVDEPIAQVETDKVTIDVVSTEAGVIQKFVAKEGDTVEPGAKIAVIEKSGEGVSHVVSSKKTTEASSSAKQVNESRQQPLAVDNKPRAPSPPTPKHSAAEPQLPPKERERRVPMTRLRKRVATRLKDSQNTFALLTTFNEVDMTNLMKLRSDYKDAFVEKHGVKLGLMSGFVKAAVSGLQNQPIINAVIDGHDIIYRDYIDISIAVGTPKGLVVPVIRNAENMNFADIEKEINTLAKKANDGSISIDEMAGGSFTISNGGVYGSLLSTPIINPPQSAILGMHSIVSRPMVVGGEILPRPMMYIALTYDHRLIDGREAVFFLRRIKDVVEDPRRLLLDI